MSASSRAVARVVRARRPHRGFETVTYLIDGEFEHEDSAGNRGGRFAMIAR